MPMRIKCPSCTTMLMLPDTASAGSSVRCPKCSTVLRVPGPAAPSAPKPREAAPPAARSSKAIQPPPRKATPAPRSGDRVRASQDDELPSTPKKSKKGLILGILGCVGLLFLVCGGTATYAVYKIYQAGANITQSVSQRLDEEIKKAEAEQARMEKQAADDRVRIMKKEGGAEKQFPPIPNGNDPRNNPRPDNNPLGNPANQANPPPANDLNTAYIPADFIGAVVLHPARLLQSKSSLLPPAEQQAALVDQMVQASGIDPRQVERAVLLVEPFPGGMPSPAAGGAAPQSLTWNTFASPTGRFSVLFPGTPKQSTTRSKAGGLSHTFNVETHGGKVAYMVMYDDLAAASVAAGPKVLFDAIAKNFGMDLKKRKEIQLDGNPGVELVLERKQGAQVVDITDRIYLVNRRMYQVMVTSAKDQNHPAEFARFLDSFKLRKPGDPPVPPPPPVLPGAAPPPPSGSNVLFFPAAIVRFAQPVDGKKILGGTLKEMETRPAAGKTYYRSKTEEMARVALAGFVADGRTILLAPEPTLKKMLAARNVNSPLTTRLRQLDLQHDVTGVFVVGPYKAALAELRKQPNIPPQLAAVQALDQNLDAVTFSLDANGDKLLQIVLHATNEAAALSLEQLARNALSMGQQLYGGMKDEMQKNAAKDLPPEMATKVFRVADQLVKDGIQVNRQGNQVTVTLLKPKDLDAP